MHWDIFQKPQRYIGNEYNRIKKNHNNKIKICLIYPELYELGMSNLGLRIIYGLLNSYPDVVCERAFLPAPDLGEYLYSGGKKLFSLESKVNLDSFDILGCNFSYELNYINFLRILQLSGIPFLAKKRENIIVLGGGVVNPEPLTEFVDVFFIGEFENKVENFLNILRKYRLKEDRLQALAAEQGFYVPHYYSRTSQGPIVPLNKNVPTTINRQYVKDLDNSFVPVNWLVPYTSIVHDRVQIEIARGCPNKCFFCQARNAYFPYRERSIDRVIDIFKTTYEKTGYENFSLLALSASNYSQIELLIKELLPYCQQRHIGISLPSLRLEEAVYNFYPLLRKMRNVNATFAVEAARDNLRAKLNKNIDIEKLFYAAKIAEELSVKNIKLYFMFGLPFEEKEDLQAIGELVNNLLKRIKIRINVSINVFIPKPFSPFENLAMQEEYLLEEKRRILIKNLPYNRRLNIRIAEVNRSVVEAVLSRGDFRIGRVLLEVLKLSLKTKKGSFPFDIWKQAFNKFGIDYHDYLKGADNIVIWKHIKC